MTRSMMEQGLGQLWVQHLDIGAISRIVRRFFPLFQLAPSL
jgi:hypothetical protein